MTGPKPRKRKETWSPKAEETYKGLHFKTHAPKDATRVAKAEKKRPLHEVFDPFKNPSGKKLKTEDPRKYRGLEGKRTVRV